MATSEPGVSAARAPRPSGYGVNRDRMWSLARRWLIRTVISLLILAGIGAGIAAAKVYWDNTTGTWWVGVNTAFIGLGGALASWFVAALLGMILEVADALQRLVAQGQDDHA